MSAGAAGGTEAAVTGGVPGIAANAAAAEDDRLARKARAGDLDAFETLYRRHAGRIHAICLRLSGDRERARELTQETFLNAWIGLRSYRPGGRFGAWLRTVAVHAVLGERRRLRRRWWEVAWPDAPAWEPAAAPRPPRHAVDLEAAIATLPAGARQVFVLHDVEGLRHREIGRLLGVEAVTSRAQLHRARRLLREALSP